MANYAVLKAAINAVIKTNGNKEITGQVLNQTLMAIVDSFGENYQFAGVAVPSTNPGTPDQNIFYLAAQAGTYTNFGATVLPAGISMLEWKNNTWSSETFFTIDDAPTAGSDHLVKSGGVKTAIDNVAFSTNEKVKDVGIDSTPTSGSNNLIKSGAVFDAFKKNGGVYDVTANNSGATFASLSALLNSDNLSTLIPVDVRHGGMEICFERSSDNKYVQYRLMADGWSKSVSDWQGVDDEPTPGSDNLIKSGGVESLTTLLTDKIGKVELEEITFENNRYIDTSDASVPNDGTNITPSSTGSAHRCAIIAVAPNDVFLLNNIGSGFSRTAYVWVASDFTIIGRSEANHTCNEESIVAPTNAAWLCLNDETTDKQSYKGENLPYQIDEKIKVEKDRAEGVEATLDKKIDSNYQIQSDNVGGIELIKITFIDGKGINTQNSTIPNDGTNVTLEDQHNYRCAAIAVIPGDKFLLNNIGGGSTRRAYAWAKSDFTKISDSGNNHTCVYETITAPDNAAWLILNDNSVTDGKNCYKGQSFKDYVDNYVSVTQGEPNETDTLNIANNPYIIASDKIAKRVVGTTEIATGSVTLDTDGSSNQNVLNVPVSIKKGSLINIQTTGLGTNAQSARLYINGTKVKDIAESSITYFCDEDVSALRILVNKTNILVDGGEVSSTVNLLNIYNSICTVNNRINDIEIIKYQSEISDVYGNALLNINWNGVFLISNGSQELASSEYITSDYIPVDTIAFLRITCAVDYTILAFDKDKTKLSTTSYSGNTVIPFNAKITYSSPKFIRICVHTDNPANITIAADSVFSRHNNQRLLDNKNVKCFAHRGSSLDSNYPSGDNRPSSIWGAYINGFDGVHVNVQFSTDGVPYCLHDETFVDGVSGETKTLTQMTSVEIDACTRDGEPIAKVESAIYMAKMMGLDVILYNIYVVYSDAFATNLINLVKKYDMFEHTWFGVAETHTTYLSLIVAAYPKAKILRTESNITSSDYSTIADLITDAENLLQTYPELNIALWINATYHPEQHFINANMAKPYNVRLAVHGLPQNKYSVVMPYIDMYTANIGEWSFGAKRRDVEKIVTDAYPEFLLGDYGNVV